MVDATYVINLDRSVDRMRRMDEQLRSHGVEYRRWPAVDGSRLTRAEMREHATPFCQTFCTASTLGCALSHIRLWRHILDSGHELALVLEDDARLVPEFNEGLRGALGDVPEDVDVLLLGCFLLCDKDRNYPIGHALTRMVFKKGRDDRRTWGSVFVPELFGGTHAYVVSRKGCEKLLRLFPKANYHIDYEMNHPDLALYAVSPDLAYQGNMTDSTIASFSFPKSLTPLLDSIKDTKRVSLAYYMDAPAGQVLGLRMNVWFGMFLVIGLVLGGRAGPYVAGLFIADVAVGGDVTGPLVAFLVGWGVRALI